MAEAINIFISYRNVDLSRIMGSNLEGHLKEKGFKVFFDQSGLKRNGGVEWEQVLVDNVQTCHVLVVLVEPETSQSSWVKREIETARKALAAVIPVVVLDDTAKVMPALKDLDLDGLQFLPYHGKETESQVISDAIQARADEVIERRKREQAWRDEKKVRFHLQNAGEITVDLVTGDATTIPGFDVLVNTENTYMQMARYFESNTLSCAIRRKGSRIRAGYIVEDTVQDQLNRQLRLCPDYPGTPVNPLEVLITEAGHPDSDLAAMDFRYILHAATVTVDRYSQRIDSIPLEAVPEIIANCLRKLDEINREKGAVLYTERGVLEEAKADFQPLTSILFPLFGAGQGGNQPIHVAEKIITGFRNSIQNRTKKRALTSIGLCVYSPELGEPITREFEKQGFIRV